MSRRHTPVRSQSVDDLFPYLGKLTLNTHSLLPHRSDDIAVPKTQKPSGAESDEAKAKLESAISKDSRSKPNPWCDTPEEMDIDKDGNAKIIRKFNRQKWRTELLESNKQWMKHYPSTTNDEYNVKDDGSGDWTSLFPTKAKVNKVTNPHWLRSSDDEGKHGSISAARKAFGEVFTGHAYIPEKNPNGVTEEMMNNAITKFMEILKGDDDTTQYYDDSPANAENEAKLATSLTKLREMLGEPPKNWKEMGEWKYIHPRKTITNLPPGWVVFRRPRSIEGLTCDADGKLSSKTYKLGDNNYYGPQWEKWGVENPDGTYDMQFADSPKDAWLIYTGYYRSQKTLQAQETRKKAKLGDSNSSGGDASSGADGSGAGEARRDPSTFWSWDDDDED